MRQLARSLPMRVRSDTGGTFAWHRRTLPRAPVRCARRHRLRPQWTVSPKSRIRAEKDRCRFAAGGTRPPETALQVASAYGIREGIHRYRAGAPDSARAPGVRNALSKRDKT